MAREPESFDLLAFLETLRQMLQNQNPTTEAELPSKLQKYGELCDEANRRLRECHALSLRGQYSNAVAVAEREPNLLQHCSELEIPERNILPTVAQILGVRAPVVVDLGLIQSLQEAYEKGSSAAANLRMLHKLTLARAPLPTRLHVMRRLLVQNPNHPFMDADIRTFERAWFKQAPEFARTLAKQGRPELIQEVIQDLQEAGYMEPPPSSLISQLAVQVARAQATLFPTLAESIRKAHAEESLVALTTLADRWNALIAEAGQPDAATRSGVDEALNWVRQELGLERAEAERDEARSRLSLLIHSPHATRLELDLAYQAALSLGGVDADLDKQLQEKLEEIDRRFKMKAVGVAVAVVFGVMILVVVSATRPTGQTSDAEPEPNAKKSNNQDDGAKAEGKEAERIETERKEAERKVAFALAMKELEDRRAGRDAQALIEEARRLARTAEEKRILQMRIDLIDRQEKLAFNEKVGKLLQASENLLAEARRLRASGGTRREVADFRDQSSELGKEATRHSYDAGDLRRIETTLAQVESWQTLASKLASLRDEMRGARGTPLTLKRLAEFLAKEVAPITPDPEMARRAALSRQALPTWIKAAEAQDVLRSGGFLARSDAPNDWKDGPASGPVASAAEYARMIRDRDATSQGTTASKLKARLSDKDIAGLWVVRRHVGNEQIYYAREKPAAGKGSVSVICLIRGDGTEVPIPFGEGRVVEKAPQSIFAERVWKLWAADEPEGWEARLAEVYDALLVTPKMEPLLKLELARRFLDLARNTSAGFREILREEQRFKEIMSLKAIALEGNWLDPGQNEALEKRRTEADQLLSGSPRLRPLVSDAGARGERRLATLKRGVVLTGWICRDDEGRPALAGFDGSMTAPGSRLFAADGEWFELGSVSADGKEIRINEAAGPFLGWPIFAIASPQ